MDTQMHNTDGVEEGKCLQNSGWMIHTIMNFEEFWSVLTWLNSCSCESNIDLKTIFQNGSCTTTPQKTNMSPKMELFQ